MPSITQLTESTFRTQTEEVELRNHNLGHYTPRHSGALISPQLRLEHLGCSFQKQVVCSQKICPRLVIIAALLYNVSKVEIIHTPINRKTDGGIFT